MCLPYIIFQQTVVYLILVAAYVAASTLVFQVHSEGDSRWSGNQLLAIGVSEQLFIMYREMGHS